MRSYGEMPERIQSKIQIGDGCWEWLAARHPDGYGKVWWEGRVQYAHRVTYEVLVGEIPHGLVIDHLCCNRGCVRPDHLEPVTQRENLLRGDTLPAANIAKETCPRGHKYDVINDLGHRRCLACSRADALAWYRTRRAVSRA